MGKYNNQSPYLQQVVGQPQTKNESSMFNQDICEACVEYQDELQEEGYNVF